MLILLRIIEVSLKVNNKKKKKKTVKIVKKDIIIEKL